MDNIRIVTDNDEVFLSKSDLTIVFNQRMSLFKNQIAGFRSKKLSKITDTKGNVNLVDPSEEELEEAFRYEGMSIMLKGIMDMLEIDVNKR